MRLAGFIARRWLGGGEHVRLLAFVATASVALATTSVLIVASVTKGFQTDLEKKLQGLEPAVKVVLKSGEPEGIRLDPHEIGATRLIPFVQGHGLVTVGDRSVPVRILGLGKGFRGPERITPFREDRLESWEGSSALIGSELAFEVGALVPSSPLTIVVPGGRVGPTGELEAVSATLEAVGLFQTGYYEYDSGTILVPYAFGRHLLGPLAPRGLWVDVKDLRMAGEVKEKLVARKKPYGLAGAEITSWSEGNRRLLGVLRLERMGMGLLLAMVLVVASMGLVGLLLVQSAHKVHGGAVLQVLGMPTQRLLAIWRWQGAWIGLVGVFFGMAAAGGILLWLKARPIGMPAGYYIDTVPVAFVPAAWLSVAFGAPLIGLVMASLLKGRFVDFRPAEVLRDE